MGRRNRWNQDSVTRELRRMPPSRALGLGQTPEGPQMPVKGPGLRTLASTWVRCGALGEEASLGSRQCPERADMARTADTKDTEGPCPEVRPERPTAATMAIPPSGFRH